MTRKKKAKKKAKKAPVQEPTFRADQRMTFVVSIDMEMPRLHVRHVMEEAIKAELAKKKHSLGAVRVYAYKTDDVSSAALHFAETIKSAASDAVSERIR